MCKNARKPKIYVCVEGEGEGRGGGGAVGQNNAYPNIIINLLGPLVTSFK